MKTNLLVALGLALGTLSATANADLIVPGTKRVSYEMVTTITGPAPGKVFFSYPCGGSDGTPMTRVTRLDSGTHVPVGSKETCQIYVVDRAVYDAWSKSAGVDGPAKPLLDKAKVCSGSGPTPMHGLPENDPRSAIAQAVDITPDAMGCTLAARPISPSEPRAVATPTPSASTAPSVDAAEKKKGCNTSGGSPFLPLALALPALVLLLRKRRR